MTRTARGWDGSSALFLVWASGSVVGSPADWTKTEIRQLELVCDVTQGAAKGSYCTLVRVPLRKERCNSFCGVAQDTAISLAHQQVQTAPKAWEQPLNLQKHWVRFRDSQRLSH